jgi:hydroxylysine kinase
MSDSVQTLKPGQVIRPNLTSDGAVILATDLYGLRINKIKELNSYDDKNFLIIPDVATNNNKFIKQIDPNGYVLKVLNAMDTQKKHVGKYLLISIKMLVCRFETNCILHGVLLRC